MKQPYNTTIYNTALYMRLSRDDELQGESGSIQTQRMMLRQYAAEHGLNVIDEYIDDGWSGTNFDRPDFQRMIDDIEDGKINCVVTKDLSRLGRNYILTGQYTEIYFPSKGVRYIAVNDNVDTINGENELAPFLNILNEMHARQTSKKVKAAMRTRFANGAHYGAYAPLGYVKDPDKKTAPLYLQMGAGQTPVKRIPPCRGRPVGEALYGSEKIFLYPQPTAQQECQLFGNGFPPAPNPLPGTVYATC